MIYRIFILTIFLLGAVACEPDANTPNRPTDEGPAEMAQDEECWLGGPDADAGQIPPDEGQVNPNAHPACVGNVGFTELPGDGPDCGQCACTACEDEECAQEACNDGGTPDCPGSPFDEPDAG
jgi:hypothetical protein